jgi:uncharacterized DUF497 family protein
MLVVAGFDWDEGNWPKCGKHGVSKAEIEQVIAEARFMVDDPSSSEKRLRTAGKTSGARYVFVAFTLREKAGKQFVRPISARYMHLKEVEFYEKEMARIEKR